MSSWGNLDNVAIKGTVVVAVANANAVLGVSTEFVTNVKQGDYITIAANKYQVEQVVSNTSLYLTASAATTTVGATAYVQQGPKYIANVALSENTYSIKRIYGVDRQEIGVANAAANAHHTGWIHFMDYTDSQGNYRQKSEVLVAMSKNFATNATLHVQVTGFDADDDTVIPDTP